MIKLALLLKFSVVGAFALAMITTIEEIGLPHSWQLLFNGFVAGWALRGFLGSYVGGMVPPNKDSSPGYVHYFNTVHLWFNRSTGFLGKVSAFEVLAPGDEK